MKGITYGLVEEHYFGNNCERISYGVAVYSEAACDGTATVVASVHDVTSDKSKLTTLVRDCNRLELSPVHLEDIIEDFLTD